MWEFFSRGCKKNSHKDQQINHVIFQIHCVFLIGIRTPDYLESYSQKPCINFNPWFFDWKFIQDFNSCLLFNKWYWKSQFRTLTIFWVKMTHKCPKIDNPILFFSFLQVWKLSKCHHDRPRKAIKRNALLFRATIHKGFETRARKAQHTGRLREHPNQLFRLTFCSLFFKGLASDLFTLG